MNLQELKKYIIRKSAHKRFMARKKRLEEIVHQVISFDEKTWEHSSSIRIHNLIVCYPKTPEEAQDVLRYLRRINKPLLDPSKL